MLFLKTILGSPKPVFTTEQIMGQNFQRNFGTQGLTIAQALRDFSYLKSSGDVSTYEGYLKTLATLGYKIWNPFKTPEQLVFLKQVLAVIEPFKADLSVKNTLITQGISLGFYVGEKYYSFFDLYFLPEDLERETSLTFNYYAQQQMLGWTIPEMVEFLSMIYVEVKGGILPTAVESLRDSRNYQGLREHLYQLLRLEFLKTSRGLF